MRIISGKYKGRNIQGYNIIGTRPTMDRVKESVIATIHPFIKGSTCLDLFAGSGAFGMELLSNGAIECVFVDKNKEVINILNKNISDIKITEKYESIEKDYQDAIKCLKDKYKFNIIFLDPPYGLNLIKDAINLILEFNLLKEDGIIICEYETEKIDVSEFEVLKEKKYGNKNILILKNKLSI